MKNGQHKMKRPDAFIVKYGTCISNYKKNLTDWQDLIVIVYFKIPQLKIQFLSNHPNMKDTT